MNISVNDTILEKYGLTLDEFLVLYLCSKEVDFEETIIKLIHKGIVDKDLTTPMCAVVSDNTKELIASIIIDSDKTVLSKDAEFIELAKKMRELFPEGKKPGTTYYWRDSLPMIARKLKTLVAKFNVHFTEEDALEATKKYVESFNGDYRYMQLLKYFILKSDKSTGDVRSEFLAILENGDQEDLTNSDWLTDVR